MTIRLRKAATRLVPFILLFAIAACGGGGGGGGGSNDAYSVSPTALTFTATQNGTTPPAAQASVSVNSGTVYIRVDSSGHPIASANFQVTGSTTGVVTITPVAPTMSPGTYTGTVTVYGCGDPLCGSSVAGSPKVISVTYTIRPLTGLTTNPASLSFSKVSGGAAPSAQTLTLSDLGNSSYPWNANVAYQSGNGWLMLSATSGGALSAPISVSVDPNATIGTYNAIITATGNGRSVDVPVTYTVQAPSLVVSRANLSFSGVNGSPIASTTLNLSMNNQTAVGWSASSGAGWLILDRTSGTTPDVLTVSVNPAIGSLASGTHNSTITITAAGVGSVTVNVSLVLGAATLTANPTSIELGGSSGGDLNSQSVALSLNTGANLHGWSVSSAPSWVQVTPTTGTVGGASSSVTIAPNVSGLSSGTHNGSISFVASVNGDNVSRTVPVTLRLRPHRLFVHDNGVALVSSPTRTKLSHTITVRDNNGLPTPWSAASDQAWLSVTASGTTPGSLVLTANPAGLATETIHYANVTISSSDVSIENSGQEIIRVGLYVTAQIPAEPATATLVNPNKWTGMAADPVRPYVYVTHGGAAVDIYNIYTGALVGSIPSSGSDLRSLAVSSDGTRLYTADHAGYRVVVADLTANPPVVSATWSNSIWSNCNGCASAYAVTDMDYTRLNGRPVLVVAGPEVIDALTGVRLVGPNASFFAYALLNEISGDGRALFSVNTNTSAHTAFRYVLQHNVFDDTVTATSTHTTQKNGTARGLSVDYDGARVYRACWYPNEVEVYGGSNLATLSTVSNGTNGGAILGPDGLVYCVRYYSEASAPGAPDVWGYDPVAGQLAAGRAYNVQGEVGERQLVISGDGLRLITRSNGLSTLTSTTIAP